MQKPHKGPAYIGMYPVLAELAHAHGYALAVHGSLQSDFDLIAVPWIACCSEAETLVRELIERIDFARDKMIPARGLFEAPYTEAKPHGRRSWCIPLECGASIDISVILPTHAIGDKASDSE